MTSQSKAEKAPSLRKRVEHSKALAWFFGLIAGSYLDLSMRTTRWTHEGLDELRADLEKGPVLMILWHSRCLMAGHHWPKECGNLSTLHTRSPIARVIGAVHRRRGLRPAQMSDKASNRATSRMVLTRVKEGISIGMTVDGPTGPARKVKDAPIDWARATGMPVYAYAFSTTRARRLNTWDNFLWPQQGGRGAFVFQKFDKAAPKKMDADLREVFRDEFTELIDRATARADTLLGLAPGP